MNKSSLHIINFRLAHTHHGPLQKKKQRNIHRKQTPITKDCIKHIFVTNHDGDYNDTHLSRVQVINGPTMSHNVFLKPNPYLCDTLMTLKLGNS